MAMRTKKGGWFFCIDFLSLKKMVLKANELCSTLTEKLPQNAYNR